MKLTAVAKHFNKYPVLDAYSSAIAFYAKLDLTADSTRDSVTEERRVMSVAPGTSMPARGCVKIGTNFFLTGIGNEDVFLVDTIRKHVVIHRANTLAKIGTGNQLLSSTYTQQAYAASLFVKNVKDDTETLLENVVEVFLSASEAVSLGYFIQLGTDIYFVQGLRTDAVGMQVASCRQMLPGSFTTASYTSKHAGYDPVNETSTGTIVTGIPILTMRFQDDLDSKSAADPKFEKGDLRVRVKTSAISSPAPGDRLVIGSINYSVVSSTARADSTWSMHVREA